MSDSQKIYLHSDAATSTETEKSVKTKLIRKQKVSTEFDNKKIKEMNNSAEKQIDTTDYSLRSKTRKIMVSPAPTLHQFFNSKSTESSGINKMAKLLNRPDESTKETNNSQRIKDSVNESIDEFVVSCVELEILEKYRQQSQPTKNRPVQHTTQMLVDEINPSSIDYNLSNHRVEPDKPHCQLPDSLVSFQESVQSKSGHGGKYEESKQKDTLLNSIVTTMDVSTRPAEFHDLPCSLTTPIYDGTANKDV